jgi:hypothetical protein
MTTPLIPWDVAGTSVFLISMAANAFSLWILLWMLCGKVQIHYAARLLMLFVNCIGILWNSAAVIRYYHPSPPSLVAVLHYFLGVVVAIGDLMSQFEILKLFHFISGLDQKRMQRLQWFSLVFCCVLGALGNYLLYLDPLNSFLLLWDTYGPPLMAMFIALFYLWYQIFLVTKLYQSMQQSAKVAKIKNQNSIAYVQLISQLVFLGLYQYVGVFIWGWGYVGTQNRNRDRMLVRVGESIGQSHLVLNVLFIKAIKKFTFPSKTSTLSHET